jgi:hypothetical protein
MNIFCTAESIMVVKEWFSPSRHQHGVPQSVEQNNNVVVHTGR